MAERSFEIGLAMARFAAEPKRSSVYPILYPHQQEFVAGIQQGFLHGEKDQHGRAPTASGKTTVIAAAHEAAHTLSDAGTFVLAPTRPLVRQDADELAERLPRIGVGKYYSDEKDLTKPLTVITIASWLRLLASGVIKPDDATLVSFDEAHYSISFPEASEMLEGKVPQLGVTATPAYGKNRHVNQYLPYEAFNMSVREGTWRGVCSSFAVYIVRTNVDLSNVPVVGEGVERDFSKPELGAAINTAARNKSVVGIYMKRHEGEVGITFCAGIEHAEDMAEEYEREGVKVGVVSSDQTPRENKRVIDAHQRGDLRMVTNDTMLSHGYNNKLITFVGRARPSLSPARVEQEGGRGNRPNGSDKLLGIWEFVDLSQSLPPSRRPVSYAQVAEDARIINTARVSEKVAQEPEYERTYWAFLPEGTKVTTDPKLVMFAVNTNFEYDKPAEFDPTEWKTTRRVSAETGIRLEALEEIVDYYRGHFDSQGMMKNVRGPQAKRRNGKAQSSENELEHLFLPATFRVVSAVLHAHGFRYRETQDEPLFVSGATDVRGMRVYADLLRRVRLLTPYIETDFVIEYAQKLYAQMEAKPEEYMMF